MAAPDESLPHSQHTPYIHTHFKHTLAGKRRTFTHISHTHLLAQALALGGGRESDEGEARRLEPDARGLGPEENAGLSGDQHAHQRRHDDLAQEETTQQTRDPGGRERNALLGEQQALRYS